MERSQITNPSIHASTLYAGKTLPQWQTIFDAERNPIAKIEAGKALVMLTDSLPPAERLNRILEIAGELVEEGFGPQPSEYLMDYLGGRTSVARAMRWPKGFQDLSDAWFHFDQLCESRVEGLSVSILADGLLRVIREHSADPKVAMAFSLLFDYSIHKKLSEAGLADQVLLNPWDINNFVHARAMIAAASYYYEKENAEAKQAFATRYSELGRRLKRMTDPNVEHQIQWIERVEINEVEIEPPELAAEIAFNLLKKHPAKILDELLHIEPLDPTTEEPMVLSEHDFDKAAKRNEVFWKYWLPLCEGYLGGGPTDIEAKRAVFSSLNVALRLRQQGRDDKAVSNIAAMLQNQWKQGVVDVAAADVNQTDRRLTPLELLTLLLHCGGELPKESGGDSKRLASFREHCDETFKDARDYKPIDRFKGLLIENPIAVVQATLQAEYLPHSMTPIEAAGYTSPIGRSNEAGPRIDPLVTLAVCERIVGVSSKVDQRIAELFERLQSGFSLPLKLLIDRGLASSEIAIRYLCSIQEKTSEPTLFEAIAQQFPSAAYDLEEFAEANPRSLLAILMDYNAKTHQERNELFEPAIVDLSMEQLLQALQDAVTTHRHNGEHSIADALQKTLDENRLAERLEYGGGVTGTSARSNENGDVIFRQFLPAMTIETGPRSLKMVYLGGAELHWSRDGWRSPTWGETIPPLTGTWQLESVETGGQQLQSDELVAWKTAHHEWFRVSATADEELSLIGGEQPMKFTMSRVQKGVPHIELTPLNGTEQPQTPIAGVYMTNAYRAFDELTMVLNLDGGPAPTSFKTEDQTATKMKFKRVVEAVNESVVGDEATSPSPQDSSRRPPQSKHVSRKYNVADISLGERTELRELVKRLAISPDGISTVSNLGDEPDIWFVFTSPKGHQRVKAKLDAWRKGDHSVPPDTPPPPVRIQDKMEEGTEPAPEKAKGHVDEQSKPDPSNPHVNISFRTESGEPASGVSVRLDQTGVKGQQPVWAEGVTDEMVAMDRVLRFGYYRMKIKTPDGWSAYVKDVAIEFGIGLDTTIVVPDSGLGAELRIDGLPNLEQTNALGELKFGTLRNYMTAGNLQSGGYSPVRTPEPDQTSKTLAHFPDAGSGIEEIAVRLRLQVTRELANPLVKTDSHSITWKWSSGDFADDGILLTNSEVRVCQDLDLRSTLPADGNPYFKMPSNVHRLEYLALKLGESKPYPYRVAIPNGEAKLMLVGIYGRPSDQVMQAIKMLPLENDEQGWLTTELHPESEWVDRVVDEPWYYAKDPGNYYGHLSRIDKTLSNGESLEIKIGGRAGANESAKPNPENESATEEETK